MGRMQFFAPTEEQKRLADLGRQMMDYSEYADMTGLVDKEIAVFNHLSHVGYMLTQVGAPFGTTMEDFTEADQKLIKEFTKRG